MDKQTFNTKLENMTDDEIKRLYIRLQLAIRDWENRSRWQKIKDWFTLNCLP
jgi:hypothetical protein